MVDLIGAQVGLRRPPNEVACSVGGMAEGSEQGGQPSKFAFTEAISGLIADIDSALPEA
jgi:hypothetical protein